MRTTGIGQTDLILHAVVADRMVADIALIAGCSGITGVTGADRVA